VTTGGTGWTVRVTPDKRPLLRIEGDPDRRAAGMFDVMNAIGAHELVTDTPEHEFTWADFPIAHMVRVLEMYRARTTDLRRDRRRRPQRRVRDLHALRIGIPVRDVDHPARPRRRLRDARRRVARAARRAARGRARAPARRARRPTPQPRPPRRPARPERSG